MVLNWNNLSDTLECLESLTRSDYKHLDIWVVDNASREDPSLAVTNAYPTARTLRNDTNLGYGGGNNVGLRAAIGTGAAYVLLLNNDVVVAPTAVSRLVAAAESDRRIGMATPVVFFYDRPAEIYWDGGFIDWNAGEAYHDSRRLASDGNVRSSEWLDGCSLFVRASAVRDIGLLDDRYFLYYEDADWSVRSGRRGWRNVVVLDAHVWHKVSRSTGGKANPVVRYYYARNRYFFLRSHSAPGMSVAGQLTYAKQLLDEYRSLAMDRPGRRAIVSAALSILRDRWGPADAVNHRGDGFVRILDPVVLGLLACARIVRRILRRLLQNDSAPPTTRER